MLNDRYLKDEAAFLFFPLIRFIARCTVHMKWRLGGSLARMGSGSGSLSSLLEAVQSRGDAIL